MITPLATALRRIRALFGGAAAEGQHSHAEVARLAGLLDAVDVGLVSVSNDDDFANVNESAAALLDMPAGNTTATKFTDVIRRLARETVNQADVAVTLRRLEKDPSAEVRTTWQFETAPTHLGVVCKPAPYPGFNGRIWAFYDNSALARAVESSNRATALLRASTDAMLDPQMFMEGIWHDGHVVDLVHRDVNKAACEYLGLSREELVGHSILETMPNMAGSEELTGFLRCAESGEPVILDDSPLENHYLGQTRYYDTRAAQSVPGWITVTWRDVTERSQLTRRIAASEEQFRLLTENVADVVVRIADDGTVTWVSNSVEKALGAPAEYWTGRQVQDLAMPGQQDEARVRWAEIAGGGTTLGRDRILGADGTPHWVHLHAKPYFGADGRRDGVVMSFRVIDDEVAAEERAQEIIARRERQNQALTRLLQAQTDRLMSDINSAAKYVASILPGDLDGPVRVSSRYVSSRELGGDSYDYRWIDDDHLIVYLLDVSGHGAEPAMVSVSVHNLLRSGTLSPETLREPGEVVAELNRLFQMEQHDGNYFTIWYGVYRASTRTLRFTSSGHPPALAFTPGTDPVSVTTLSTAAIPVGVFDDTTFDTGSYEVPPGAEILVYSDGAFELGLDDGAFWSLPQFIDMCRDMIETGAFSLDGLVSRLKSTAVNGIFEDDCTLVRLTIP